jgi:hypothetical protein
LAKLKASQQRVERPPLGRLERLEQTRFVGHVSFDCLVDHGPSFAGQPHQRAAAVVRVGSPFDKAGLCKPVEPLRDAAGGQHRRGHQLGWVELVRLAAPP